MKRLCFVFLSLFVFAAFVSPVAGTESLTGKSIYTNPLTLDIGTENRSAQSSSAELLVPGERTYTNPLYLWVGRHGEINFVLMQGEAATKNFTLSLPTRKEQEVELASEGFGRASEIINMPREVKLEDGSCTVGVTVEVPEGFSPGSYGGSIAARAVDSGERVGEFEVEIRVLEKPVEELGVNYNTVEKGGTLYRWYRTYPNSRVIIGGPFSYSQPDEEGLFHVKLNTSEMNYTAGSLVNIRLGGAVRKNGEISRTGDLNFTLKIVPRSYSTEWTLGSDEDTGAGIVGFIEGREGSKFTVEYDTQNILQLTGEERRGVGAGVGASLFSTTLGPVEIDTVGVGGSTHIIMRRGSSKKENYNNCSGEDRVSAAVYMLTGAYSQLKPIGGKFLEILLESSEGMKKYYAYSGVDVSCSGEANLIKADISIGDRAGGDMAGFSIGGFGERKGSYTYKKYQNKKLEAYSLETVGKSEAGLSTEILGSSPVKFGPEKYFSYELVFRNRTDMNKTNGFLVVNSEDRNGAYSSEQLHEIYSLGDVKGEEIYRETVKAEGEENYIPLSARAWSGGLDDILLKKERLNKTVEKSSGRDIEIELPFKLEIGGAKITLSKSISFGRRNKFLSGRFMIKDGRKIPLEVYPDQGGGPLRNLSSIISYSLRPLENSDLSAVEILTESVKEGKLSFPSGSLETGASGEFLVKIYSPADYQQFTIDSNYISSLSASEFASSNVTDIEPLNESDFSGEISLDCKCPGEDVKIHWWNGSSGSWEPLETDVSDGTASAQAPGPGSYVIGEDTKSPAVGGNISTNYLGNLSFSLKVSDRGTGVDTSSVNVLLNGSQVNFSYSRSAGELRVNSRPKPGNYTLKITASDKSGNTQTFEKKIRVVKPSKVKTFEVSLEGGKINLEWSSVDGTYPIEKYIVLRDGSPIDNTTSGSLVLDNTNSSMLGVYPVDKMGNIGYGKVYSFRWPEIIPRFEVDWEEGLRPRAGTKIRFDASPTVRTNGSVEVSIRSYGWKFLKNGTEIAAKEGISVNKTFEGRGKYSVVLNITDSEGRSFRTRKNIYIEGPTTVGKEANISLNVPETEKTGKPGSWVTYKIFLRNDGDKKDLIVIDSLNCSCDWRLAQGGKEVSVPFPDSNVDERILGSGESEELELSVKVPDEYGASESIEIAAFSFSDPSVESEVQLLARSRSKKETSSEGGSPSGGGQMPLQKTENTTPENITEDGEEYKPGEDSEDGGDTTSGSSEESKADNKTVAGQTGTPTGHILASKKVTAICVTLASILAAAGIIFYLKRK